jgi:5-(carboxyamino)imidazole ribonucleotide synthase
MTIGIVGAGQLGRMLALAGYPLGLDFLFLDKDALTPGAQLAPTLTGAFTDAALLQTLAERSEVITFDWENISVAALQPLRGTRIAPPLKALAAAQDRLEEKRLFERLGIATTRYAAVDSLAGLADAAQRIGLPGMLKTRRLGYDGKGQVAIHSHAELAAAWASLQGAPLIYEELVPFDYEVSVIGARSTRGEVAIYPLNRNQHAGGILRVTRAPWRHPRLQAAAARALRKLLAHFRYTGVLTVEFFVRRGRLVANEIAPRVHNTGHWTIEGAVTSQFENHLRAILGLPLGDTRALGHCAMVNLIGTMPAPALRTRLLGESGLFLHDYGKSARPGRKLGHCTLVATSAAARDLRTAKLVKVLESRKIRS